MLIPFGLGGAHAHVAAIVAIHVHAQDVASDPLLIVLRGLPGSGKSTLGKAIKAACRDGDVVSETWNRVSIRDFFIG